MNKFDFAEYGPSVAGDYKWWFPYPTGEGDWFPACTLSHLEMLEYARIQKFMGACYGW